MFESYKSCLEAAQLENKINYLEKNINIESLKNHKQVIRNNNSLSKIQQIFKSDRHNVFAGKINKIALSSNDDKIMQLIDMIETYVYVMNKDLVCKKERIKCKKITKQYKNVELWLYYKRRHKKT